MVNISSNLKNQLYKVEITSPSGNTLIADEPLENGGQNLGFSPHELLAAALAACTSATVKMYANRKEWALDGIKTHISLEFDKETQKTSIVRNIELAGDLDEVQRAKLLYIANVCPVHKILSNPIEIDTKLI